MSKEVGKSLSKTTLGGKYNKKKYYKAMRSRVTFKNGK